MKKSLSLSKQLAFSALFAALCLIGTLLVTVPLPMGYFNVGDVFVLLAGWCLALACITLSILYPIKSTRKLFPCLESKA